LPANPARGLLPRLRIQILSHTGVLELRVRRASPDSRTSESLADVAGSICRALFEVVESGVTIPPVSNSSADLDRFVQALNHAPKGVVEGSESRTDLARLRDALASAAWSDPTLWVGEIAVAGVHDERSGWKLGDEGAKPFRTIGLAIDVIDFCAMLLGSDDALSSTIRDPSA
jgi:hypothetical protein